MEGRYNRNMPALSLEECVKLRKKRVCVVGCGGLGGYIIEILARIGVGAMTVVDGDEFEESNLNRQLLSDETLLGTKKAEAAVKRVAKVNSDVAVTAEIEFFTEDNGMRLLDGCDLVVDALDNAKSRHVLASVCAKKGLTIVHGAISGWYGQVAVVMPGSGIFDLLYPPYAPQAVINGSPSFTPAVCASIQAAEVIKLLCDRPSSLVGKLLLMDLQEMVFDKIDL